MARFCPRCGGLLQPTRNQGEVVLKCTRCGHRVSGIDNASFRVVTKIKHSEKEKIVVVEGEDTSNLPVTREVICKKCGNTEAYYWMIQTRAADEPSTRFYKCTRCGHVWREYE